MAIRDPEPQPDAAAVHLARRIASAERLRLVLLLATEPDRSWSGLDLAVRTGLPGSELRGHVHRLAELGLLLVDASGDVALSRRPDVRADVEALARLYTERPEAVLRALNDDAIGRVRAAAAKLGSEPPHDAIPLDRED